MSKITVARVYRVTDGSALLEDITDTVPATGGRLKVEAHTDFDPAADGEVRYVVIDDEAISYTDVDEATDELVDITRGANSTTPAAHTAGTFVQAGLTARTEKFADGFIDDDDSMNEGVEIMRHLYPSYAVGDRDHADMELATVKFLDDGHPVIVDAPVSEVEETGGTSPVVLQWSLKGAVRLGVRPHQMPAPFGGSIEEVRMALGEDGEADDDVTADILVDGASILTTKVTVASGQSISPAVEPTDKEITKGQLIQVEFEDRGTTLLGYDPTFYLTIWPSPDALVGRIEVEGPQGVAGNDGADALITELRSEGTAITDAPVLDVTGSATFTSDGSVATLDISAGAMTQIASTRLGSSAASISFASIPQTYNHLLLVVVGKTTDANPQNILMRFNADSGNNYHWQLLQGNGTTASASNSASTSSIIPASAQGSGQTSRATAYTISIPEYTQTNFHKNSVSHGGRIPTDVGTGHIYQSFYGHWKNTAAITTITLTLGAGNFDVGTIVTLYGLS